MSVTSPGPAQIISAVSRDRREACPPCARHVGDSSSDQSAKPSFRCAEARRDESVPVDLDELPWAWPKPTSHLPTIGAADSGACRTSCRHRNWVDSSPILGYEASSRVETVFSEITLPLHATLNHRPLANGIAVNLVIASDGALELQLIDGVAVADLPLRIMGWPPQPGWALRSAWRSGLSLSILARLLVYQSLSLNPSTSYPIGISTLPCSSAYALK